MRKQSVSIYFTLHLAQRSCLHASLTLWRSQWNGCFGRILAYDVEKKDLTGWSREYSHKLSKAWKAKSGKVMGFAFNPSRPNTVLVYSETCFCELDLTLVRAFVVIIIIIIAIEGEKEKEEVVLTPPFARYLLSTGRWNANASHQVQLELCATSVRWLHAGKRARDSPATMGAHSAATACAGLRPQVWRQVARRIRSLGVATK